MGIHERRAAKHVALERLIVDAGAAILRSRGARAVSLRAIAQRIEYSPATIYGYFATKDALLAAVAAEGFRRLNEVLVSPLDPATSPLDQLREFYWRYYAFSKSHPAEYELMFIEARHRPDTWQQDALVATREARDLADTLIRRCAARSELPYAGDPSAAHSVLWIAMHGAAIARLTRRLPADIDPDRLAADTLDAVLRGFCYPPSSGL